MYEYYNKAVYELKEHNPNDYFQALDKIREWDYNSNAAIATGLFYEKFAPAFEDNFSEIKLEDEAERELKIKEMLKEFI